MDFELYKISREFSLEYGTILGIIWLITFFTCMNGMMGGWQQADTPEVTDEIAEAFSKAAEKLLGVDYEPVAVLSRQVVAGTNYCILCESKVVAPDTETEYCFVYLYVDLEGNSEITDIVNVANGSEEAEG